MNPSKSIKSRYSVNNISNNYYGVLNISTLSGSTILLSGSTGGNTPGYIYAPYIMMDSTPIFSNRKWKIKMLREDRKEKLKKLGWS